MRPPATFRPPMVRGAKGGGGGKGGSQSNTTPTPVQAVEAPNSLRSKAVARVIDLLGEGPIKGLVNGAQSIYLDETPLEEPDGHRNFEGLEYEERLGTPDQAPLGGFNDQAANPVIVGVDVKQATPAVRQITNATLDRVKIVMRFPQMTTQDTTTGNIAGATVFIRIELQPAGGAYATVHDGRISGKNTSPYERTYDVPLTGAAPWNLRVTRVTPDSDVVTLQNTTIWAFYTEHIDQRFSYPDSALIGIKVDSQQFGGNVPRRAYEVDALLIQVPSNYDPETRIYTGIWDGTFKTAFSDNGAWVLNDVLTKGRYGLGEWIAQAAVDKFSLYAIGQYCDEMVPDGFGGMEPRFTFNGVINTRQEAYRVVQAIASTFRTMTFWATGAVGAVQDAPSDPVILVTPANVVDGEFAYSGSGLKARHTVALVTWNDPADGFRPAIEVVEDQAGIERFGWREIAVGPIGTTSRGQARRVGKWLLDSERSETEVVTYTAGLDHYAIRPGDVVAVADPWYAGIRRGGRIAAATAAQVTLDAAVTLAAGETYQLGVMQDDLALEFAPVTTAPGTVTVLDLAPPLAAVPSVNNVWALTGTDVAPRPFRVLANVEKEKTQFEVSALFRDVKKYARIEDGIVFDPPPYSTVATGELPAPTDISFLEYLYLAGPRPRSAVTFSWSLPADPRVVTFLSEVRFPGDVEFTPVGRDAPVNVDVFEINPGDYGFRVRAADGIGRRSRWATVDPITLQGLLVPPEDPTGFTATYHGQNVILVWDPPTDLDVIYGGFVRIKFSRDLGGYSWGSAQTVLMRSPPNASTLTLPAAVGVYLLKFYDSSGVPSVNPAIAFPSVLQLEGFNVVETIQEAPGWAGAKFETMVIDSRLKLADPANRPVGYYHFANKVDTGEIYISAVVPDIRAFGEALNNFMAGWSTLREVERLSGTDQADWDVTVEIRVADAPGGPFSPWAPILLGNYQGRVFEFRLRLETFVPNVTPSVGSAEVVVDMPDRVAAGEGTTDAQGAASVTYSPAFKARPVLALTLGELHSNADVSVTNETRTGFDLSITGPLAGSDNFRYLAKGYGREYAP